MSNQINLLSRKRKRIFNKESLLRLTQLLARSILVVTIISSVVVFILNRSGNLSLLEQQDKTISSNLSFVQQKIIKFLLIKERLESIDPLINNKSNLDKIISEISASMPADASVDSFSLSNKTITLAVSSTSLSSINSFLDFVIDKVNKKELFEKVTVTSLSSDTSLGKYVLNITALYYE